jgi:hypothetical protein
VHLPTGFNETTKGKRTLPRSFEASGREKQHFVSNSCVNILCVWTQNITDFNALLRHKEVIGLSYC